MRVRCGGPRGGPVVHLRRGEQRGRPERGLRRRLQEGRKERQEEEAEEEGGALKKRPTSKGRRTMNQLASEQLLLKYLNPY